MQSSTAGGKLQLLMNLAQIYYADLFPSSALPYLGDSLLFQITSDLCALHLMHTSIKVDEK